MHFFLAFFIFLILGFILGLVKDAGEFARTIYSDITSILMVYVFYVVVTKKYDIRNKKEKWEIFKSPQKGADK